MGGPWTSCGRKWPGAAVKSVGRGRLPIGGYDVEREVGDIIVADHVREVLGGLPDVERRPIELAYFRGHTYREVAAILGEPEGTVKSRIRSGLKRMHGSAHRLRTGSERRAGMTHDEIEEMLGVYALDALDAQERQEVDDHLASCPRCRAELAAHREVAALLGNPVGDAPAIAPEDVWDRIASSLQDEPPARSPLARRGLQRRSHLVRAARSGRGRA